MRLKVLIDAFKTYDSVLEKFEKWVDIENELLGMDRKMRSYIKSRRFNPDYRRKSSA